MKEKYIKIDLALYNENCRSKLGDKNRTITNRSLWIESLSLSLWHQEYIILSLQIQKRDNEALSIRMPKIQRTKEEAQKGGWNSENASGKTTRKHEVDKAYLGIYQCNR